MPENKKDKVELTECERIAKKMIDAGYPNKCADLSDDPALSEAARLAMDSAEGTAVGGCWQMTYEQAFDEKGDPIPGKVQIYYK
jgi:hypothetical protein